MTDKRLRLNIPLVLPEVPDERDSCLTRLDSMIRKREGITDVHLVRDVEPTELCIHYDPEVVSLSRVRHLTEAAGAKLHEKYGHFLAELSEASHPRRADSVTDRLLRVDGVLEAEVSPTGAIRVEYERDVLSTEQLRGEIDELGLHVQREFAEHDHEEPTEHAHEHDHEHDHGGSRLELGFAVTSGVFLLAGWLLSIFATLPAQWMGLAPLWLAFFFGGFFTTREAIGHIKGGEFKIDFLMLVAAVGAAALGRWVEGALLLFLFSLGHSLEHYAMARARNAIESLAELAPEDAIVLRDGDERVVPVEELRAGDRVRVKPNERIPADGFVVEGESAVNQAPVTGESVPADKRPVDDPERAALKPDSVEKKHRAFAGTINGSGALTIQVTKRSDETTLSRVVEMVTEAETMRAPTQQFTDKFERWFVPSVIALVVALLFAFTVLDETFADSFYRAMAVLVAASPCALAIATPSAVLSAVAAAGNSGVLVKGGGPLEHMGELKAMAFDKTGTLTEGEPQVTSVHAHGDATEDDLVAVATAVERLSDHPIARAVVRYGDGRDDLSEREATDLESITGRGVRARIEGDEVLIGKEELFDESEGPKLPDDLREKTHALEESGKTTMIVRHGDRYLGVIGLMDIPREGAREMIDELREAGITDMIMISGDNQSVCESVAAQVGLDRARGDLMPDDKVEFIRELHEHGKVAMVGDGVNDAPAMANATVAVAMGAAGSDTALETAEIALMADDLGKLPYAVHLSRKTSSIIRQNLWLALGMVAVLIPATLLGLHIGPAVALHEGSTIAVVFNALRLLAFRDG